MTLLRKLLPRNCKIFDTSSLPPECIIQMLQGQNINQNDIICLNNADVWRYGDDPGLLEFFAQCPATILIFHLGYQYRKILDRVHEIPWPIFFFTRIKQTETFDSKPKGLPWGVGCLNNKFNIHRLMLGYQLWSRKLIPNMVFTQNNVEDSVQGFHRVILDRLPGFEEYESLLPIQWAEPKNYNSRVDCSVDHDAYSKCYANIVTETEAQSFYYPRTVVNTPIVTEKSYKPFLSGQIPLYLAADGHLAYLKNLGFRTVDAILPDNYDQLGIIKKISALVNLVEQGRDYMESIYFDNLQEIKHNYELIHSDKVDNTIISNTKSLIDQCLSDG